MNGSLDLATTDDAFLGGRLQLLQPARGYRAAVDPVLLAAGCRAAPGARVVDLGCGVGTAMLCLAARVPGVDIVGVELHRPTAGLARRNVERNGFAAACRIVEGDVADPATLADFAGRFDVAIANPPYLPPGRGTRPPDPGKAMAHVEGSADLAAFVACAARLLRPGGEFVAIHRADRIDELVALVSDGFGGATVLPVAPRAGEAPRRALLRATRAAVAAPRRELPPFVLHEPPGAYTAEADRILRGEALEF